MKRVFSLLLLFIFCTIFLASLYLAYNGDTIVYVTRTGECYHRDGCSYLKSKIEMTLEEAVISGYRACSRCCPPSLDLSTDNLVTDIQTDSPSAILQEVDPTPSPSPSPSPTPEPTPEPTPDPDPEPTPEPTMMTETEQEVIAEPSAVRSPDIQVDSSTTVARIAVIVLVVVFGTAAYFAHHSRNK